MNDDTIKLLKECSSGICMARDAIDEILEDVRDDDLKGILQNSIKEHDALFTKNQKSHPSLPKVWPT